MATFKQDTVRDNSIKSTLLGPAGRDQTRLEAAFKTSPMYIPAGGAGALTESVVEDLGKAALQGAEENGAVGVNASKQITDALTYYGTSYQVNLNYVNDDGGYDNDVANNMITTNANGDTLQFGEGGGAPTSPYVPSLSSPGQGSAKASSQEAYPVDIDLPAATSQFGSGADLASDSTKNTNPAETSLKTADITIGAIMTAGESGAIS